MYSIRVILSCKRVGVTSAKRVLLYLLLTDHLSEIKNLQKHQPKNVLPFLSISNLLESKNDAGTTFCDSIPFIPLLTLFTVTEAVSGMGFLTSPHNSLKGQ